MIQWLLGQFDTLDFVVLTVASFITIYFFLKNRSDEPAKVYHEAKVASSVTSVAPSGGSTSFVTKMKSENRQVLILFGSQTGTAEELAGRLSKDLQRFSKKAILLDPEEMDVEDFEQIKEVDNALVILCMATYGEGDSTDNALQLYEYLSEANIDLNGLHYAVFGLGNKTYEHFNAMGKFYDRRLEELGAKRVSELGLGDDDGNLEEDFMRWREIFWPAVQDFFGWELSEEAGSQRQYRFEVIEDPTASIYTGEFSRIGAFEKQRPPFDQRNPYIGNVRVNRELHKEKSDRSCRHIEISTSGARVRYEAGDHLAVFPTNSQILVEKLGRLLDANMDQIFRLVNVDEDSSKRHSFPCPCSIQTAFTHYVDICAPVKSHVLKALAEYTTDPEEKGYLILLSTVSEKGLAEYGRFIQRDRRSIIDVLQHFKTCKPPVDYILELLPRLQARYYSISSSPKYFPECISITAVVTSYTIGERLIKGVCTSYLLDKEADEKVPVFVRRSTMRLPHKHTTPVIMIGPGTGFAPFRGFIMERQWQKEQGKAIGPMALYFGCRNPEHDYIYEDELVKYKKEGVLSELHLAFSRITNRKIYVQDKLWENRVSVWNAVEDGAYIYVCGDARNMARDVQNTFLRIFIETGGKTPDDALKYQRELEKQRRYQADVWS